MFYVAEEIKASDWDSMTLPALRIFRTLFLVIICFVSGILYSLSKGSDFLKRDLELGHKQQQIDKRLPPSREEDEITLWRNYLKKYPLPKDATELELQYSFPSEDLLEKDIYFWMPTKMDGDSSGNIFISDQRWGHIFKFAPSGNFLKIIGRKGQGPGEFMNPYCLCLTKDFLIVSDTNERKIQFFDRDGKYLRSTKALKPYYDIAADAGGLIFASPFRMSREMQLIDVLDKDGKLLYSFGESRFGNKESWNVINFLKLAVNGQGEIFAAFRHFPTICRYSQRGELLAVFKIEHQGMKERERLNFDAIAKKNYSVTYQAIYGIRAGREGFYILYNYPRTEILEFNNNGKLINDYYYVRSHDYRAEDFFVREAGKNEKIFYILQRTTDYKVDVLGIRKRNFL